MSNPQIAVFAGGCFWCTEPVFSQLKGVNQVISGYVGGHTLNPTYKQICNGDTGHAEGIQINFDADQISFETLLDVFFCRMIQPRQIAKVTMSVRNIVLLCFARMVHSAKRLKKRSAN